MLREFGCSDVSSPEVAARSQSIFQTGWFVESLLTQTLIIHVIRTNKIPFLQSRPSTLLLVMSLTIVLLGIVVPYSPLGHYLGFSVLPPMYWPFLVGTLLCYMVLTQAVKTWLLARHWI